MVKHLTTYLILICLNYTVIGYANPVVDSLELVLKNSNTPEDSIYILNQLSENVQRINPGQSATFAQDALTIAKRIDSPKGKGRAYVNLAMSNMLQGQIETALELIDDAERISKVYRLDTIRADAIHRRGLALQMSGNYAESLINYHEALRINQVLDRKIQMYHQLNNMSIVRRDLKDYDLALDNLQQGATLLEDIDDKQLRLYNSVNFGYVYLDQGKFQEAFPFVNLAVRDYPVQEDSLGIAIGKNLLAEVHLGLKNQDLALSNADTAFSVAKGINYRDGILHSLYTTSAIAFQQKRYTEAIQMAKEALELSDTSITTRYVEGLLSTLVDSYRKLGKEQLAIQYMDQLLVVKEGIFAKDNENLVYKLEVDNRILEKEKENQALLNEVDLREKLIAQQKYLNLLISCIGLLFFVLCFILYKLLRDRNIQKVKLELAVAQRTSELEANNQKLIRANEELERFAYITSHDLKEPLRSIMSFTQLIKKKTDHLKDDDLKEYASYVTTGTAQLYALIESILDFSRLNTQKEETFEEVDLNQVVHNIKKSLVTSLEDKDVEVVSEELPTVNGNPAMLYLAIKNLIENGIKFNDKKAPKIEINYQDKGDFHQIAVRDNGIGISKKYHKRIFAFQKSMHF